MARFIKGEVVVIPFPFSDLSGSKRRPALVLADLAGDDILLCQITSQNSPKDILAIPLLAADFKSGALSLASNIRPNRLFTADKTLIIKSVGVINAVIHQEVIDKIHSLIEP
jgi:mRNA interferase MazF